MKRIQKQKKNAFWLIANLTLTVASVLYFIFLTLSHYGAGFQWAWLFIAAVGFGDGFIILKHGSVWGFIKGLIGKKGTIVVAVVFGILVTAFLFIEGIIIFTGSGSSVSETVEYAIVLGAKYNATAPSRILKSRLDAAYEFYQTNPNVIFIVTGGQGPDEPMTEAAGMAIYLHEMGVPDTQIILEPYAENTYENIMNSYAVTTDMDQRSVAIITSNFHMLRARFIATKLGHHTAGIPSETPYYLVPHYYLREAAAIIKELFI